MTFNKINKEYVVEFDEIMTKIDNTVFSDFDDFLEVGAGLILRLDELHWQMNVNCIKFLGA